MIFRTFSKTFQDIKTEVNEKTKQNNNMCLNITANLCRHLPNKKRFKLNTASPQSVLFISSFRMTMNGAPFSSLP